MRRVLYILPTSYIYYLEGPLSRLDLQSLIINPELTSITFTIAYYCPSSNLDRLPCPL